MWCINVDGTCQHTCFMAPKYNRWQVKFVDRQIHRNDNNLSLILLLLLLFLLFSFFFFWSNESLWHCLNCVRNRSMKCAIFCCCHIETPISFVWKCTQCSISRIKCMYDKIRQCVWVCVRWCQMRGTKYFRIEIFHVWRALCLPVQCVHKNHPSYTQRTHTHISTAPCDECCLRLHKNITNEFFDLDQMERQQRF